MWKRKVIILNLDEIKKHMRYFMKDKYDREFYVALVLYDVFDITDNYDSIYEEFLKYDLQDLLNGNYHSEEDEYSANI